MILSVWSLIVIKISLQWVVLYCHSDQSTMGGPLLSYWSVYNGWSCIVLVISLSPCFSTLVTTLSSSKIATQFWLCLLPVYVCHPDQTLRSIKSSACFHLMVQKCPDMPSLSLWLLCQFPQSPYCSNSPQSCHSFSSLQGFNLLKTKEAFLPLLPNMTLSTGICWWGFGIKTKEK